MSVIETMIDIPAEHEQNVCGQFDAYLKKIERTLHVTMIARNGEIKIIEMCIRDSIKSVSVMIYGQIFKPFEMSVQRPLFVYRN